MLNLVATKSKTSEHMIHNRDFPECHCPKLGVGIIHAWTLYTNNYDNIYQWNQFIENEKVED